MDSASSPPREPQPHAGLPLPPLFIAEDDPEDLVLLKHTLTSLAVQNPLQIFGNGNETITCLRQQALDGATPRLLLLDLHLPQIDGCGVVAWIKRQPALRDLRIVVISGSGDSEDVRRVLALGAHRVLEKPAGESALRPEIDWLNTRSRLDGAPYPP